MDLRTLDRPWEEMERERKFRTSGIAKRLFALYRSQGYEPIGNPRGTILMRRIDGEIARYVQIDITAGPENHWTNRWNTWIGDGKPDERIGLE